LGGDVRRHVEDVADDRDLQCVHEVRNRGEDRAQRQGHVGDGVGVVVAGNLFSQRVVQSGLTQRPDIASAQCHQRHTVETAPLWGAKQIHHRGRDINDLVIRVDESVPESRAVDDDECLCLIR
jgi:hypothetical protein